MSVDLQLTNEDRTALKGILLGYRAEGVAVPLLPLDVDMDGDGITDAWGLDEHDEVILVSGVDIEHSVYVSEGDDLGTADD